MVAIVTLKSYLTVHDDSMKQDHNNPAIEYIYWLSCTYTS